ncbi:MAG: ABC transporter permease [Actinomycetes bacterium]
MSWFTDVVDWLGDGSHWTGADGVPARFSEHLVLTGVSVGIACVIALPLALWLGHLGRGGTLAINLTNIGRAVPTFAVLVILAVGPLGIGNEATITALVLFAIPPVLTNAYVGMREVDRDVVEAARGMGMSGGEVLRKVEVPLAMPLIMAGVRLSAVQVVATATLAAVVAGGGLGRIITGGLARQDQAEVVAGAFLVAVLALAVELSLGGVQRLVDPARRARRRGQRAVRAPAVPASAAAGGASRDQT